MCFREHFGEADERNKKQCYEHFGEADERNEKQCYEHFGEAVLKFNKKGHHTKPRHKVQQFRIHALCSEVNEACMALLRGFEVENRMRCEKERVCRCMALHLITCFS